MSDPFVVEFWRCSFCKQRWDSQEEARDCCTVRRPDVLLLTRGAWAWLCDMAKRRRV